MTYSDAHIQYWGRVYRRTPLRKYAVTFERFLGRPHDWLHWLDQRSQFLPLLPQQRDVQRRLDNGGC